MENIPLNAEKLLKICSLNGEDNMCREWVLRDILLRKYPVIDRYKGKENWREFFLRAMYYICKMKEEFNFAYSYGDFKKQYHLLKKYGSDDLLVEASKEGQLPIVIYSLNQNGADINAWNDEALFQASKNNHSTVVKYLIQKGANVKNV